MNLRAEHSVSRTCPRSIMVDIELKSPCRIRIATINAMHKAERVRGLSQCSAFVAEKDCRKPIRECPIRNECYHKDTRSCKQAQTERSKSCYNIPAGNKLPRNRRSRKDL